MTLITRIKAGEVPDEIKAIARDEACKVESILEKIVCGKVVIPKNINRPHVKPVGIGEGLTTKVNANIGTSEEYPLFKEELKKLEVAIEAKADTVMDLSTGGDLNKIRKEIIKRSSVPIGTVPIYQAAIDAKSKYGNIVDMTKDHIFEVIREQVVDGVDFITVHCGVTRKAISVLNEEGREMDVVSRGGAFMMGWILHNNKENPLYEEFDELLSIAKKYDVTLSLGDGMRPGCIADATDCAQIQELLTLGELVDRAREAEVQVMVEGPGHVPLNQIETNIRLEKEICKDAPFYVLGPIVTDVAPGYDHIVSAIGGAFAASVGADFLCYVTSREHLGLPTANDVKEGVIVSKIAAHVADIAKGLPGAKDWDLRMTKARRRLDWENALKLAIDPEKARNAYEERKKEGKDVCTMCGDFCALKLVDEYLGKAKTRKMGKG
ncbi:MAG TPA: phosphomethylpyrimidine synthase ThiC [Actinobacteria bacterium]|nr:phosphomethylpyrimidine synthase ThiC [Actinomycetota bacterium]